MSVCVFRPLPISGFSPPEARGWVRVRQRRETWWGLSAADGSALTWTLTLFLTLTHTLELWYTHARTHIPSQLLIMQPCLSPSPCDTPKCDSIVLVERKARDGQRRVPACFGACVCVCVFVWVVLIQLCAFVHTNVCSECCACDFIQWK